LVANETLGVDEVAALALDDRRILPEYFLFSSVTT